MQTLLNLSEAVSLAFHTMGVLGVAEGYLRTQEIAERLDVSFHHLHKVHQRLAKAGLIRAVRGPKGGYCLNRPAKKITLKQIYEAVEGPLCPHRCMLGRPKCKSDECLLGDLMDQVNRLVQEHFTKITVAQLAETSFSDVLLSKE